MCVFGFWSVRGWSLSPLRSRPLVPQVACWPYLATLAVLLEMEVHLPSCHIRAVLFADQFA